MKSEVAPHKRIWLRHKHNGQVGYLVDKGGVKKVKLDREDPYALRLYDKNVWVPMQEVSRVQRMQVALVQWRADRELLRALGERELSKKDWHKMPVPERIEFMDEGPKDGKHLELRRAIWLAIKEHTNALVEGIVEEAPAEKGRSVAVRGVRKEARAGDDLRERLKTLR